MLSNGSFLINCNGQEDEGLYQCKAENSLDTIVHTASLDVQSRCHNSKVDFLKMIIDLLLGVTIPMA